MTNGQHTYPNVAIELASRQKQAIGAMVKSPKDNWPIIARQAANDVREWFFSADAKTIIDFIRSADPISEDNLRAALKNNSSALAWFESAMQEPIRHKFSETIAWLKQEAAKRAIQMVLSDASALLAGGQMPVSKLADSLIARLRPHVETKKPAKRWNLDQMLSELEESLTTGAIGGGRPIRLPWSGLRRAGISATVIRPQSIAVIAAGTGIGKTTLTLQIILNAILNGQNVIMASNGEWTGPLMLAKLAQMHMGAKAGYSVDRLIETNLFILERNAIEKSKARTSDFNEFVSAMKPDEVRGYVNSLKALRGDMTGSIELVAAGSVATFEAVIDQWQVENPDKVLDLIVMDYLQAFSPQGATEGVTNYAQTSAPTAIAEWLLRKVTQLSCAGLAISQLTKEASKELNNGGKTTDTGGQNFRFDNPQLVLALESDGNGHGKLRVVKNNFGNGGIFIMLERDHDKGIWIEQQGVSPDVVGATPPPVPAPSQATTKAVIPEPKQPVAQAASPIKTSQGPVPKTSLFGALSKAPSEPTATTEPPELPIPPKE